MLVLSVWPQRCMESREKGVGSTSEKGLRQLKAGRSLTVRNIKENFCAIQVSSTQFSGPPPMSHLSAAHSLTSGTICVVLNLSGI